MRYVICERPLSHHDVFWMPPQSNVVNTQRISHFYKDFGYDNSIHLRAAPQLILEFFNPEVVTKKV